MPSHMKQYTVEEKIRVVQWHRENGKNVSKTSRVFCVDRKRVREWNYNYESLLQNNVGSARNKRKLHNGREPMSAEVDNKAFEFLTDERSQGRAVSSEMLMKKAREIAAQLNVADFKGSVGWLRRWKKRFHVTSTMNQLITMNEIIVKTEF